MSEKELMDAAKRHLKEEYGEETVSMKITKNKVVNGSGNLHVDCIVKYAGANSDWSKIFQFKDGKIISMSARRR